MDNQQTRIMIENPAYQRLITDEDVDQILRQTEIMIENPLHERVLANEDDKYQLPKIELKKISKGNFIGKASFILI